ncbi:hypothetical protein J6590_107937, partial [Homalodisca vitripennis]
CNRLQPGSVCNAAQRSSPALVSAEVYRPSCQGAASSRVASPSTPPLWSLEHCSGVPFPSEVRPGPEG